MFGERAGVLRLLVDRFKFDRTRAAYRPIASLLGSLLPYQLSAASVIVPLPTIARHVRQRGYDHTSLILRSIARSVGVGCAPLLTCTGPSVQRGASRRERIEQPDRAFVAARPFDPDLLYILVDDIVTTGALIRAASYALSTAGAIRIWVVALARQPLDEQG